jgi:predicted nucleic acid-binding Zn ribbon protein
MITYLYKCGIHGEFEAEHSIKEVLTECPKCKEENINPPGKLVRLIASGGSFILKDGGSGWARNGYN